MTAIEENIAEYPFLKPRVTAGKQFKTEAAFAASNMRALLKRHYPSTRFNVKSKTYAGGESVYVSWADVPGAPSENEVYALLRRFQDGSWDGMGDTYVYDKEDQLFREAFGGVRLVLAHQRCPTAEEIRAVPTENVDAKDEFGCTLLYRLLVKRNPDKDVLKALLDLGPDPDEGSDEHGATLLMVAARNGRTDAAKVLLNLGADVSLKNKYGHTAQMLAEDSGYAETAKLLRSVALEKTLQREVTTPTIEPKPARRTRI